MEPKKPTFLIIGAAKCGTTALASILSSHPDCCMSQPKEVSFFQDMIDFQPNPNYEKGWEWYQQAFTHYAGESVVGEATPSYSDRSRSPTTAQRIYEFNPNMKIIYMVREPLQRQISAWRMQWAEGIESIWPDRRELQWALKSFDYWMQMQRDCGQWDVCRYGYQLAAYEHFFHHENICVSFLDDWQGSKNKEIYKILNFLGLNLRSWDTKFQEQKNSNSDRIIERPFFKKIRSIQEFQFILKYIPLTWRNWMRTKSSLTRITIPPAQLANETKKEFLKYIKKDSENFLEKQFKGISLWDV